MTKQITKAVRLPGSIIKQIERIAQTEGSTLSQFLRTAALEKLDRKKKVAS